MPADSVFDGPVTSLLSTLCILIEILSPAHAKGEKSLNDFKFGTFTGCFPSDGAASMGVNGLKSVRKSLACQFHRSQHSQTFKDFSYTVHF